MSAIDIYDDTIEALGRGDHVAVLEDLKHRAVAVSTALRDQVTDHASYGAEPAAQRDGILGALTVPSEELLAALFPIIEHGNADDHAAVAPALQYIVDQAGPADRAIRCRKPSSLAVWAPDSEAYLCRHHAEAGVRIAVDVTATATGSVEVAYGSAGRPGPVRSTPIRRRAV